MKRIKKINRLIGFLFLQMLALILAVKTTAQDKPKKYFVKGYLASRDIINTEAIDAGKLNALVRKGRLIAKYEFGKLDVVKAQRLSDHLALDQKINRPRTLAEITNPGETEYQPATVNIIGF